MRYNPPMEHRCLSPWKGALAGTAVVLAVEAAAALVTSVGAPADARAWLAAAALAAVASFYWTWILGKIPGLTLKDAALYGAFFGLCVAALGPLMDWARGALPGAWAARRAAATVAAWTLASPALARCFAAVCALPR